MDAPLPMWRQIATRDEAGAAAVKPFTPFQNPRSVSQQDALDLLDVIGTTRRNAA